MTSRLISERELGAERRLTAMLQQSLLLVAVFKQRMEANMAACRAEKPWRRSGGEPMRDWVEERWEASQVISAEQPAIVDAMRDPDIEATVIQRAPQVGWTEICEELDPWPWLADPQQSPEGAG